MKVITTAQMKDLDRRTISDRGVPGAVLMERAGCGVFRILQTVVAEHGFADPRFEIVAGHGNNGGDAFVVARYLHAEGYRVGGRIVGPVSRIQGDARSHFERMDRCGVLWREFSGDETWGPLPEGREQVIVDGILGTGVTGAPRGESRVAVRWINAMASRAIIVSIDLPSGLNADTGETSDACVRADVTATMAFPKSGLVAACAVDAVGRVEVVDIGIPPDLSSDIPSDLDLITPGDLRSLLPRRKRDAHKGDFGSVLIIGGARGFSGAPAMAAMAAAVSGVGLVTVLTPESVAAAVAGHVPEAMVHPGKETDGGALSADALEHWPRSLDEFSAVLIGPGLTPVDESREIVKQVLTGEQMICVLDADALNVCAGHLEMLRNASASVIVTPHPGEMARLMERSAAEVQADRLGIAGQFASDTGAVTILKGAGTLVAGRGRRTAVNLTGNPGMATGGMGDVLAGLAAGLAAQGMEPFDASCLAVFLHGRAGDMAARSASEAGVTPVAVVEEVPYAFRDLSVR